MKARARGADCRGDLSSGSVRERMGGLRRGTGWARRAHSRGPCGL